MTAKKVSDFDAQQYGRTKQTSNVKTVKFFCYLGFPAASKIRPWQEKYPLR